jgi:hypothetical protein
MAIRSVGGVVWPASRIDLGESGLLDAEFLAEQLGLLLELVVLGSQADVGVDAVGSPATGGHDSVVGQRDDVQDGGLDVLGPSQRQGNVWQRLVGQW